MRRQYHSRAVGADIYIWDVHRLIRLSRGMAFVQVSLGDIRELEENWWFQDDQIPTPRAIAGHMRLVQQVDFAHPVILCAQGRLMDGMHRCVRALIEGDETIGAIRFETTPAPDFINVTLESLPYGEEPI